MLDRLGGKQPAIRTVVRGLLLTMAFHESRQKDKEQVLFYVEAILQVLPHDNSEILAICHLKHGSSHHAVTSNRESDRVINHKHRYISIINRLQYVRRR